MPGLTIALNGKTIAAVSTEGRNILGVRVHGDVISPEFASVDVSGGLYGEEPPVSLTWVSDEQLQPGDEIEVRLIESVSDSHRGKTIEELFPDEPVPTGPWQPLPEMFDELSRRPRIRDGFRFHLAGPEGEIVSATQPNDHSFGFSVTWNWLHPERVRVSLSSNTLAGIASRSGGTDYANLTLHTGQHVKLRVDA